jgi:4a-hydroxytetrahydrobiopterin dehydratase
MSKPLNENQITAGLSDLPGWSYDTSAQKITKTYQFAHFKEAMGFLVRVAFEAELLNHHPEIFNVYCTVTLSLNTHDADGKITQKDMDLAKAIETFNWLKPS